MHQTVDIYENFQISDFMLAQASSVGKPIREK
jgi:hypothetical protein